MNIWQIIVWTLLLGLIQYLNVKFNYWHRKGIQQLKINGIWGIFWKLTSMDHAQLLQEVYNEFKGKTKLAGTYMFTRPIAVIMDLDLVKTVLIKDFGSFVDRFENENVNEIHSQHLFNATSEIWNKLRTTFTPTFTTSKLKCMFPKIVQVAGDFTEAFDQKMEQSLDHSVEMHDINGRFATDVFGTCLFGVECNSLKQPNVDFRQMGKIIFGAMSYPVRWFEFNMSYGLYELAKNPQIQDKLREEICMILKEHNNELTYDAMMEMSYLDQVITETLRLYPALPFLQRICKTDYKVPDTDITLDKGTIVCIPAKAIHCDADIYENPMKFQPERFTPSEVLARHPQSFLGFGDGPRNCIGMRFGRMPVKIGLIALISKYRFNISEKTPNEGQISNNTMMDMVTANGVWLRAEKL